MAHLTFADQIPVTEWYRTVPSGKWTSRFSYETGLNGMRCDKVKRPASNF